MSSADSQLMNYVVRMVVPMRREFGLSLDVRQFLRDHTYANEVLGKARASTDPRLRECVEHVEKRLLGPRMASAGSAAPAAPAQTPVQAEPAGATEEELRARMMKKYTTGLR
jgi:hypothetical protein